MDKLQMLEASNKICKRGRNTLIAVLSIIVLNNLISQGIYNDYKKSGELFCAIDGYNYEKVDKLKVVEYDYLDLPFFTLDTWYFTNGFSTSCYVKLQNVNKTSNEK